MGYYLYVSFRYKDIDRADITILTLDIVDYLTVLDRSLFRKTLPLKNQA